MTLRRARLLPSDEAAANWDRTDQRNIHWDEAYEKAFLDGRRRGIVRHRRKLRRTSRRRRTTGSEFLRRPPPLPPVPRLQTSPGPRSCRRPMIPPPSPMQALKPQADAEPAPRRHLGAGLAGTIRYAYWEPFPIYFPHLTRHHGIYWSRIPWFF